MPPAAGSSLPGSTIEAPLCCRRMERIARRGWYVFGVVASAVIGIFFALACIGGVIGAASTSAYRARNSETFGGDVALAVVSAVIVIVCMLVGAHLEHQLRRHHPVANAWSSTGASYKSAGPSTPGANTVRRRRYSPAMAAVYFIIWSGLGIGMAIGAGFTHAHAERSSEVQHHGIPRIATVTGVENHFHSSRGGGFYTADIFVSLSQPVDGRTGTTVHYPGRVQEPTGSSISVLIDPADLGYAELPGSPATQNLSWIILLVVAVLFLVLDAFVAWMFVRFRRHRRSFNRVSIPPTPVSA